MSAFRSPPTPDDFTETASTRLIPVALSLIIVAAQDFLSSYANNRASASTADVGLRCICRSPKKAGPFVFAANDNKGSFQSRV